MTAGEECEEEAVDSLGLAHNHLGNLGAESGVALNQSIELFFVLHHLRFLKTQSLKSSERRI